MNVLLIGGAGYIGTALLEELTARKDVSKVIIYDNLSRSNYNLFLDGKKEGSDKVKFMRGELLDSRQLSKVLKGIDVVYHLAAKVTTPFANTDPHFYEQVNHWGTAELVYAIEESDVKKVIYVSSTAVYGATSDAVDEKTIPNPRTFYGISKYRGEEHVKRLENSRETFILRCGNVYGYNRSMRFDAVINKFVFEANFNRQIQIHGDGKQHRAFVHIRNVACALARILDNNLETGTYNLVDRNVGVLDIVDELKMLIPDLEFIFINQHLKLRQLKVSTNKHLKERLGLKTDMSFTEELREFLDHFSF
ncbi:NAD-dependent epimerase/dehydratase family protein [Fulvivirga sedimenti]|uniref:NAD-dependent epimerase/dehydratase family protein n=1 Tax=Fulvivirga sedimenti TaxID=2879465 RepID=A0A9X1KVA4_9BACT|nr:SDR family oxidoreductase [Fulvivirga sedimenti]MCA6073535.1 NAD-dependent epimerase/dehydratase family protein [Fulvivirga sedimenti]